MKYTVPLMIFFSFLVSSAYSQFSIKYEDASDGQCNGSADLSIVNSKEEYTFLWSNGVTDKAIQELCPGNYTVTITSSKGCEWVLSALIGGRDGCYLDTENIQADIRPACQKVGGAISISIDSPIEYQFSWSNKENGNHIENLPKGEYCVTISSVWQENCSVKKCYTVTDEGCTPNSGDPVIMINEVSNGTNGDEEYVELLVLGTGDCRQPVDLQGYILDDNNGDFSYSNDAAGISPGSLRFAQNKTWANVPVGSLILIYDERHFNPAIKLKNDPDDSNGDRVYVLPSNSAYFERFDYSSGGSGALSQSYSPSSAYSLKTKYKRRRSDWSLVGLLNAGDAMQMRYPDTKYCHGVSYGNPATINGGPDQLYVGSLNGLGRVILFGDGNPRDVKSFSLLDVKNSSPGLPNSKANAAFIDGLCSEKHYPKVIGKDVKLFSSQVRPNPFKNSFDLEFEINETATVEISLRNIVGVQVYFGKETVALGRNKLHIQGLEALESGFYILTVMNKQKTVFQTRIVKIK